MYYVTPKKTNRKAEWCTWLIRRRAANFPLSIEIPWQSPYALAANKLEACLIATNWHDHPATLDWNLEPRSGPEGLQWRVWAIKQVSKKEWTFQFLSWSVSWMPTCLTKGWFFVTFRPKNASYSGRLRTRNASFFLDDVSLLHWFREAGIYSSSLNSPTFV